MQTDTLGVITQLQILKPGDLFIWNWENTAVFGIVAKFENDEGLYCAFLNSTVGKPFALEGWATNDTVWKVEDAIVRPKIELGTLRTVDQIGLGALMMSAGGCYLVCRDYRRNSIRRLNLETGLVSTPSEPYLVTTSWELGIRDSKTQAWRTMFDSSAIVVSDKNEQKSK